MSRMDDFTIVTESANETIELGTTLGACLKQGHVVALKGHLGSGKTCFTKGIARGLGIGPTTIITSPSFALVNEYPGKTTLFHIDVYRLETLSELLGAGIDEYLHSPGVAVMEWADRWPEILPDEAIEVELFILDESSRRITLSGGRGKAAAVVEAVRKAWES
ncbi:MAG: tRNA (adenosine(37)-N6)-threonylcarbamoyltransferase complex ATPase subunit type 1 TsaE [Desulfatiglandales bacterium]